MRFSLAQSLPTASLLIAVALSTSAARTASGLECYTCGNGTNGIYGSPDCVPVLEAEPNWNLYWFNCSSYTGGNCPFIDYGLMPMTPTWYGSAEFVPLFRDTHQTVTFASLPPAVVGDPNVTALSTADFDNDFNSGGRFTVGHQIGEWYRLEASYLGFYTWNDDAFVRDVGGTLISPFVNTPAPPPNANDLDFVRIGMHSEMKNAEVNLRRRLAIPTTAFNAALLIGGRYMEIEDQITYHSERAMAPVADVNVATRNRLAGFQLGLAGQWLERPRMWVDFEVKGSINRNLASQQTAFAITGAAPAAGVGMDEEERTSFAGDLLLAWNYNFAPSWTLRLGYQATWVTGVAIAAENFQTDFQALTLGPAEVNHAGEVVYHGPVIGLTWVH